MPITSHQWGARNRLHPIHTTNNCANSVHIINGQQFCLRLSACCMNIESKYQRSKPIIVSANIWFKLFDTWKILRLVFLGYFCNIAISFIRSINEYQLYLIKTFTSEWTILSKSHVFYTFTSEIFISTDNAC